MIYIQPDQDQNGYHEFQVYDEPDWDGTPPDPSVRVCYTRAELVRAIHEIDLHSNAVMADEVDEDPADLYLPKPGTRVRVLEVNAEDPSPVHKVGDVVIAGSCTRLSMSGSLYLSEDDTDPSEGTWCIVEPAQESPCDANGYTPEGHAWLPAPGQTVRVVWRFTEDRPCVGEVITWYPGVHPLAWAEHKPHSDRSVVNEDERLMRVVPA